MENKEFIKQLINLLRLDPNASLSDVEYITDKRMNEYFSELLELDDSLSSGIINAIEIYLDK